MLIAAGAVALLLVIAVSAFGVRVLKSLRAMENYLGSMWAQSEINNSREVEERSEGARKALRAKLDLPLDE